MISLSFGVGGGRGGRGGRGGGRGGRGIRLCGRRGCDEYALRRPIKLPCKRARVSE